MDGDAGRSDLDRRLDEIWQRSRPIVLARIDAIERGTKADADADTIGAARAEAHKLRGLFGTIGIGAGSTLAGAIEDHLEAAAEGTAPADWQEDVAAMLTSLRVEVDSR